MCNKNLKYQKDDGKQIKNVENILWSKNLNKVKHPFIWNSYGINIYEKMEDLNICKIKVKTEITTVSIFLEFLAKKLSEK